MERRTPAFASSIRWQSVNVVSQVVLQLLFIMALARLISKADFGVMSIALVVVGFVEIFAQIGIGPSLVQRKDLQPRHIRAAMHFSIGLGVAFFALMYGIAPHVGVWFNSEALVKLDVGGVSMLSRITRKSVSVLGIAPGREVFAQVKAIALLD